MDALVPTLQHIILNKHYLQHVPSWKLKFNVLIKTVGFILQLSKYALKFRSEAWVLKKREELRPEAAQMKFLRHLLEITKLDEERINLLGKNEGYRT
jgi:hypothetical protein